MNRFPMKFNYIVSLLFVLFIFSCTDKKEETNSAAAADSATQEMIEQDSRFESVDSSVFRIGNYTFEITPSTESEFDGVKPAIQTIDTSEAKRINPYSSFVTRNGDSLLFKKPDNEYAYLINNTNTDSEDFASYDFIQYMPEIGSWLVMGSYYEAYGYILVNKTTGDMTQLFGVPVVSPDKKYMLTFNQDLQAGFTFNGFQFFEIKDKPVLIGTHELYNWGPDNVVWKDSNTLLVQQAFSRLDEGAEEIKTAYVEIHIK